MNISKGPYATQFFWFIEKTPKYQVLVVVNINGNSVFFFKANREQPTRLIKYMRNSPTWTFQFGCQKVALEGVNSTFHRV